eukprot:GHVH01012190.1.p1 GENE.GHVH01012190.1~~GHVH01012190.1.p1  ORF type:complete len:118 (+),score=2.31 GHVH01012190.1:277-630(+)
MTEDAVQGELYAGRIPINLNTHGQVYRRKSFRGEPGTVWGHFNHSTCRAICHKPVDMRTGDLPEVDLAVWDDLGRNSAASKYNSQEKAESRVVKQIPICFALSNCPGFFSSSNPYKS